MYCGLGRGRRPDRRTYVHEEVEREAEREEPVGEGAHGRERAEVEREHEDGGGDTGVLDRLVAVEQGCDPAEVD